MRSRTWDESEASHCRWSEYAAELFGDWQIIWDDSVSDYQGTVRFLAHKDGKFAYLTYSYGSCSGCDGWEGLPDEEVREDMRRLAEYFDNIYDLKKFADQVNYGEEFERVVDEYTFYLAVDSMLEKE